MVRQQTVEERIAAQEAKAAQIEGRIDDAVALVGETRGDVDTLSATLAEARAVLARLQSYEADLKWLRDERRKAR